MLRLTRSSCSASALLVVLALLPASADHCTAGYDDPPEFDGTPIGVPLYVDNDLCQPECSTSVWVYEESNGIPGLQRDDPVITATCHGTIPADTLVVGLLDGAMYSDLSP